MLKKNSTKFEKIIEILPILQFTVTRGGARDVTVFVVRNEIGKMCSNPVGGSLHMAQWKTRWNMCVECQTKYFEEY